jgi:acyl-coenzyme A synthetase/AMP-(fatty) acid ligase
LPDALQLAAAKVWRNALKHKLVMCYACVLVNPDPVLCYAVVVLQDIPHTATGKVSKLALRKMFANHKPNNSSRTEQPRSKL